jgi:hypothetical protein
LVDLEGERKRRAELVEELRDKENKRATLESRVRVLEELVENEQRRIYLLSQELEQHEKGFVKELLQIELDKYINKFQTEIKAMEKAQLDERDRMKKLLDYQLADQAALHSRRVKLYEDEIQELQARLE